MSTPEFTEEIIQQTIDEQLNGGIKTKGTVEFTIERVMIVRGIFAPSDLDYFLEDYTTGTNRKVVPWENDPALAATINAHLVIGRPDSIQKFKQRLNANKIALSESGK